MERNGKRRETERERNDHSLAHGARWREKRERAQSLRANWIISGRCKVRSCRTCMSTSDASRQGSLEWGARCMLTKIGQACAGRLARLTRLPLPCRLEENVKGVSEYLRWLFPASAFPPPCTGRPCTQTCACTLLRNAPLRIAQLISWHPPAFGVPGLIDLERTGVLLEGVTLCRARPG